MSSKDLTEALRALTEQANNRPSVQDAMNARGATGRSVASAPLQFVAAGGNGGGIASPLVETGYADRTFHGDTTITSSDGLFTLKIKPVKSIKFKDSLNHDVVIEFKAPA